MIGKTTCSALCILAAVAILSVAAVGPQETKGSADESDTPLVFEASSKRLSVSSYPLDDVNVMVALQEEQVTGPSGTIRWYLNGPKGLSGTIKLKRLPNSGGHHHPGGPTGTVRPSTFTLGKYPQNLPVSFTAPDACGIVEETVSGAGQSHIVTNVVMVRGLTGLFATTGISLIGYTPTHQTDHWGTPDLVSAIQALGRAFHAEYGKNIFVNDISLPTGGLFDHKATWARPHQLHRFGRDVDIRYTNMTKKERKFFKAEAERLKFRVEVHQPGPHWHLYK